MVGMTRNKRTFWYAQYGGEQDVLDSDGRVVDRKTVYGKLQMDSAAISEGAGSAVMTHFGLDDPNTRIIGPVRPNCPINAYSKVWIDVNPAIDKNGKATVGNDYVVSDVRRSLNHLMIVVRKTNNGVPA